MWPNLTNVYVFGGCRPRSGYNALQSTLERRFKNGFGLVANYTWSHERDNFFSYRPLPAGGFSAPFGNGQLDMRQRLTVTFEYWLPFGKNTRGFAGVLAKGWQFNGIAQLQTGTPFLIHLLSDVEGSGLPSYAQPPNLIANPNLPSSQRTLQQWFNTAAFQVPPIGTWGDMPKWSMFGPGAKDLDFSVFKNFSVRENTNLQFRTEFFNLFNHPNFGSPNGAFGSAAFGSISSTAFGQIGEPRRVQFALKLTF